MRGKIDQMKKYLVLILMVALALSAENLIKNSDFSNSPDNLVPECRTNGGKASLYTEDLSWNKCGKLEITKINKDADGNDAIGAAVWIGGDKNNLSNKNPGGFKCKPDTVYQFSVDIRGNVPSASITGVEWKADSGLWNMQRLKSSVGGISVQSDWTNYKGSFKTGPDASNAALCLSIWGNSKYGPLKFKVGDYILFDNVVVTEQKPNLLAATSSVEQDFPLNIKKTISASKETFSDFSLFKSFADVSAATSVEVSADKTGISLVIDCDEPLQISKASNGLWSGDVIEIFFGDKAGDRRLSQFVTGPGGEKFAGLGAGGEVEADWTAEISLKEKSWQVKAYIPFASLGWINPKDGDTIAFNVARQRKIANELQSWAPVKTSFHDVEDYGILLLGNYPDAMNRSQYELAQAEKEVTELKEKFARNAQRTFLAAPVRITSDFTTPFLPNEVFDAPEKIELRAAINELKPLALAIANTTEKAVEYRVVVERMPVEGELRFDWHDGRPFPGITLRQGIAMRDAATSGNALLDPLPKLNEASTILVPAKEAGLLWVDFDTSLMEAGNYEGRIRIIPLNGKGGFTQAGYGYGNLNYDGEMLDLPFLLKVDNFELSKEPSLPGNYFSPPYNQEVVKMLRETGMRLFSINPWSLGFPLDKETVFKAEAPNLEASLNSFSDLSQQKFFIGYSCYDVFLQLYRNKKDNWADWLRTMGEFLQRNGVQHENCYVEVYDEPDPKRFDEILYVLKIAKETIPNMKLTLTLGAKIMTAEQMEALNPWVDCWILWSHGYFRREEHLAFIKKAQSQGKEIGHYTCDTAIRSSLDRNYRRNAWFGEYHGLDMNALYQGITGLKHCMWKKSTAGEILYHGNDYAIPSMRYMAFRQGMTDVKYLDKLRELGKGNKEVEEFLQNAAKRVVVDFGHDPNMPDKVREEAAKLILKLVK